MNIFSNFGGTNSYLWILILLLLAGSYHHKEIDGMLSGSLMPILVALVYSMWKNGTLSQLFCGTSND